MQSFKAVRVAALAAIGTVATSAFAVTDTTWVTSAVTAFKDDMVAYIGAAVGLLFAVVALSVGVNKVMALLKRAGK